MIKQITLALALFFVLPLSAKPIDPMTQAVLNAYEEILQEDPGDYTTLYQRALQYYQLEMYSQAVADIERAIRLTPDSDKDIKAKEYELQAGIYAVQHQYQDAVNSIRKALALQPDNYEMQYRMGEFALLAGDTDSAKAAFTAMQRRQSRSPEAMLGMARVDVAQGKLEEAMAKMKQAEEFNSSLWTTHQGIGDLLSLLGQPQQAAMAYIKAIAMADGQSMPLESLFKLASTNYPAVKLAIDEAVKKSPNSVAMPLLLGNVAFETGHYRDASQALNSVLNSEQGRQPGVYSLLAECLVAQGRPAEAEDYASRAVQLVPTAGFLSVKARAQRSAGNSESALNTARQAIATQPGNLDARMEEAQALIALGKNKEALESLDAALAVEPTNLHTLLIAAYVHDRMNDGKSGDLYLQAATLAQDTELRTSALTALKGIAQLKSGKTLDGDGTLREMIKVPTADRCYWAAVAYAAVGDKQRAEELAKQARELGFENLYMLDNATGPLTLRP